MKKKVQLSGIGEKLRKYKYPVLVLLLGVALMLLPRSGKASEPEIKTQPEVPSESMEQRLEGILSQISGAGSVRVMLTTKEGQRTVYQENVDADSDAAEQSQSSRTKTSAVVVSKGSSNQEPVVQQVLPPVYQGAVVVSQGADDPNVRLAIVQAVSNLTGLGADKITVVKMK